MTWWSRKPSVKGPRSFPNLRKGNYRAKRGWSAFHYIEKMQSLVPTDVRLAQKIGIRPGEKVLVFAGSYGEWAKALSTFCEVHYTDISKEMISHAQQNNRGNVRSFHRWPAELAPRKPGKFDWSFSFEPYPLVQESATLPLVLLRSMLNKQGAKIVLVKQVGWPSTSIERLNELLAETGLKPERLTGRKERRKFRTNWEYYKGMLQTFARLYGTRIKARTVRIQGRKPSVAYHGEFLGMTDEHKVPCSVITLRTNIYARRLAQFDLAVLHILNIVAKNKKQKGDSEEIAKQLNCSVRDIEKSRDRLEKITPKELEDKI